ncbi:hypothetical protein [Streptomyces scopuliridis]|uniref:Uncharacterized protein n=1 Tax=Streptomyces scopuliridis TaxID=452529 RepID=A0ACD4ZZT4_9ACTN|nr:hypothetical protein [Streptomyces scopuliridis]WSC02692.1 hypothetical protein OG835_40655 [Streptomyces scopuliridis]
MADRAADKMMRLHGADRLDTSATSRAGDEAARGPARGTRGDWRVEKAGA